MRKLVIFELPFRGRDEFLPLAGHPTMDVSWVKPHEYRGGADVIILPGSGRTMSDLVYLRENGGDRLIREHLAGGGTVIGICGGYQMLGERLYDPFLKQGSQAELPGIGLLPIQTTFGPQMMQAKTKARLLMSCESTHENGGEVEGVEIRSGYSQINPAVEPGAFLPLTCIIERDFQEPVPQPEAIPVADGSLVDWKPGQEKQDGLVSKDRKVWGTYIHLIFHNPAFRRAFFATMP
ncbi:MAG: hypothetical protein IT343_00025 [Candidatus Melainabacteria bacterium]|jgi:adenosylcobyric acid synthase|nr:hypothetical protein [Candidatus Melainabacteria bacterium]